MRLFVPRRALLASGLLLALLAGPAVAATAPTTVAVLDHEDAIEDGPDLTRVAATRMADGSVRVAISLADELKPADLLSEADGAGPPGSICARLWTVSTPRTTSPDLLACVTSRSDAKTLRATITKEVAGAFPSTVGTAKLTRPSDTSLALVIPSGLFAKATSVRFAFEATRAGCVRVSCTDLAPDLGATKTLRLRG